MNYPDLPVVLMDLPTSVHGFICLGEDYLPCIVINSRLPQELQRKVFLHEMKHYLRGDMDDDSYHEYGDAV